MDGGAVYNGFENGSDLPGCRYLVVLEVFIIQSSYPYFDFSGEGFDSNHAGMQEFQVVLECRGIGLIQGIKVKKPVGEIINRALERGLLIISARDNVIRLLPPLIIEKEQIDEMIEKLKWAFNQ